MPIGAADYQAVMQQQEQSTFDNFLVSQQAAQAKVQTDTFNGIASAQIDTAEKGANSMLSHQTKINYQ